MFIGQWEEMSPQTPVPEDVAHDSREWATIVLNSSFNPYVTADHPTHIMYRGVKGAPDKLLTSGTALRKGITRQLLESLQLFIINGPEAIEPENATVGEVIDFVNSNFLPILSEQAEQIVRGALKHLPAASGARLAGDRAVEVASAGSTINAITDWTDRVDVIWFRGGVNLMFYKAYHGYATQVFRPGTVWFH